MICPYCKKDAPWVDNAEVYGRRYGKSYMCYYCRDCDAYVGCHNNTQRPLGTMANKELRELRKAAHVHIDPLYKSGRMKRGTLYKRLQDYLGREIHIGEADEATCRQIATIPLEDLAPKVAV